MMAASRTRPGNPERGWNDPPMFNYSTGTTQQGPPKRSLNKRVAFPVSGPQQPGHAVLNPSNGPPIINPVLPPELQGPPRMPAPTPMIPIGLRDTPLGNQAPPTSPVQLLPPTADATPPQTVPLLVPGFVPAQPVSEVEGREPAVEEETEERLEELMSRLSVQDDEALMRLNLENLTTVLDRHRSILTVKACDEIQKKLDLFRERWEKGALGDTAKSRITQMTIALQKEDTERANHFHLALMVDHITEVNQWMVGVKRLLQQQQLAAKERELSSQTDNQASGDPGEATPGSQETGEATSDSQETGEATAGSKESGEATVDGESQELPTSSDSDTGPQGGSSDLTANTGSS